MMARPVPAFHPILWATICAALLSILALAAPTLLFTQGPFDALVPLDAGIRLLNGYLPSIDYPSPIGILYAAIHALVMSAGGIDARSIWWANILVLVLCFGGLLPVTRDVAGHSRFLLLVSVAAMLLLPIDIDVLPPEYRYIANYNNWAWGFLAIVLGWALQPEGSRRRGDIVTGLALVALFFLKLSIFAGALPLMLVGLMLGRQPRDYLPPLGILATGLLLGCWHGLLPAYLADNIAVLRATDPIRVFKLEWQMVALFNLPITITVPILWYRLGLRDRTMLALVLTWLLLHVIGLQNNYKIIPVIGWPVLLLLPRLPKPMRGWPFRVVLAQVTILAMATMFSFILQPTAATAVAAAPLGDSATLGSRLLLSDTSGRDQEEDHSVGDAILDTDTNLHAAVSQAQRLINGRSGRIATLEFANIAILSYPDARPASFGPLWNDFGRNFSLESYVAASQFFREADFALMPKHYRSVSLRQLVELYRPWLATCATLAAENDLWQLLAIDHKKNPACANDGARRYGPLSAS